MHVLDAVIDFTVRVIAKIKYNKAELREKRIAIAKDAIEQLNACVLVPGGFSYLGPPSKYFEEMDKLGPQTQVSELLKGFPYCNVCARGAIFVAAVKRYNNLTSGEVNNLLITRPNGFGVCTYTSLFNMQTLHEVEDRYFSRVQIGMIEYAYEGCQVSSNTAILTAKEIKKCYDFYLQFGKDKKKRMVAILENVAMNGDFKP